ncbi:MAG: Mercuric resistance operon regulatory protein [Pelotomaculum sp. PtaB.Bin013]|uniref:MerR family transcriptional regulator n=1 Tax=Pelotomaculum isophthalicicum JI TaxID=947010 RepID=A0A9X4GZF8_9FIRM|nr:MerR family transcriptional regulator [Pelotomaculum isophthalicicum]MDF9408720.1 MerR family transcriptional regulator [Pelotomaculum isophthalicicum JI]OPX83394.1 MAG: Mercuric resistance operon regulatory protein [Pelotomaculum sp. PtaB.Bin013]
MEYRIKISDFAKLTGSTLKTVIYYHKIGLLQEPERSPVGYRLYGPAELSRMRLIKRLKSLGLDLNHIKEILGDSQSTTTLREVLQSLRTELLSEKKSLEERVAKIDTLLNEDKVLMNEDSFGSPSFQMISEILGPDQIEKYIQTCPALFDQQRKLYGILDDFQWGEDYRGNFRALAEYFKEHPEQYQISLDYGVRLAKLAQLPEDAPEVEALARESAEFIKSIPQLREMLCNQPGIKKPLESLYNNIVSNIISPAQMKHMQLLQQYLNS